MVKCDICKEEINKTFLNKIKGTYMKVEKKQKIVCQNCQKQHSVDEIREKLE